MRLREFLSSYAEIHAFWMGFWHSWSSILKPPADYRIPKHLRRDIRKERHYYYFGYFIGRVVQVGIILVVL